MDMDLKSDCLNGIQYKYGSEWTRELESKQHWEFYWHQQKIMEGIINAEHGEILEIGVGSGFTANYCRSKGFKVTTLDIDADKHPDIIGNAVSYEFPYKYDYLMAFEVFEHMPYTEFEKIVFKIPKFVRRYAFISLPRNERVLLSVDLKLPKIPSISFEWRILKGRIATEAHHWEIDYKDHTTEKVERLFLNAGLKIIKQMKCNYIKFYALEINTR